jgi:hypothetical protein
MGRLLDILKLEHSDIHLALFATFGGVLLVHHFGLVPSLDALGHSTGLVRLLILWYFVCRLARWGTDNAGRQWSFLGTRSN